MTEVTKVEPTYDIAAIQQKIAGGLYDDALVDLHHILEADISNVNANSADAKYMAAVCCRYINEFDQAQQYLDELKDTSPDKGRVYQEQGHLFVARHLVPQALVAFQTACQLNPALIASWNAQAKLFSAHGSSAEAQQAQGQVQRLQALPKALVAATDLIAQGKLFKAEALCKKFLQQSPTHGEAMRLLAGIALHLGAMEEAEFILESAVEFNPDNAQIKIDYISVLRRRQKFESSMAAAETLYQTDVKNPQFQSILAIEKMQIGDYQGAITLFDRVLETLPKDAITHTSKGHALKTWGKQTEAISSYQAAIGHNAGYGEAYYALSNLKTYQFGDAELEAMLALEASETLSAVNRVHLYFALGKAYEDQKLWGLSFDYYQKGNRVKKQQSRYDAGKMSEELLAQRSFFSENIFSKTDASQQPSPAGYPDAAPIFIVGLPRAGSTLLEQVLSSHSMVDGTLELPNMLAIAQKLRRVGRRNEQPGYPEIIATLGDEELYELGKQYIDETKIHRQGAPFFIDKMPNNFRHIGLIRLILPNAKIIDARRHPAACCFSGFKQLFAEGQEFTYSLDDIAQYYIDYVELMDHWDTVLPGEVLRVHYEDMTGDTESQIERILDYCGLPFEAECLEFHKTKRAVRTASSEQVRQPIYQSGVDHWQNFETQLQPLLSTLAAAIKRYED